MTEWQNPGPSGHVRDYVYAGSRLLAAVDKTNTTLPSTCGGNAIPNGAANPITMATSGAVGSVAFEGSACRRVSVKVVVTSGAFGCGWVIKIVKADGSTLPPTVAYCGGTTGFLDTVTLPASGAYTVIVDPAGTSTGAANVYIYDVVDVSSSMTAGGASVPVSLTTPGQNARVTFTGALGQRVSVRGTNATITGSIEAGCDVWVRILKPDSTALTVNPTCMEGGGFIDVATLPSAGVYTVLVDPVTIALGSLTLTMHDVPADVTGSITPGGALVPLTITTPGQNASLTFNGTAGQRVSLNGTNATITGSIEAGCDVWVRIKKPDNSDVSGSMTCMESGAFMEAVTLPSPGVYTILIDPATTAVGTLTLALYTVVDVTGAVAVNGAAVPVSLPTPGQVAQLTFTGTNGQQVTVRLTGNTIGTTTVKLLKPNGSLQTSNTSSSTNFNLTTQTLTVTGTYTVVVDPSGTRTGGITVAVTNP